MPKSLAHQVEWERQFKAVVSRAIGFYRRKLVTRQVLSEIEQDALVHLLDALEDMTQAAEVEAMWRGIRQ